MRFASSLGFARWVSEAPQINENSTNKGSFGSFSVVSNRWLVTRSKDSGGRKKQWIVESDYLYPPSQGVQSSGISYPYSSAQGRLPFRFMGRALPLEAWKHRSDGSSKDEYLGNLTAVGYGEPAFAAFYTNCHSVFGCFDDDYDDNVSPDLNGLQYDLIGWYSDPS